MEAAYTDAAGRVNTDAARINIGGGILGSVFGGEEFPLTSGIYTFGTDVRIISNLYLKGNEYSDDYDYENSTEYENNNENSRDSTVDIKYTQIIFYTIF